MMLVDNIKKIKSIKNLQKVINYVYNIHILSDNACYLLNDRILLKNFLFSLLAIQKNKIEQNNTKKINIKRLLEKRILTKKKLYSIYKLFPNLNRNIGSIPAFFLENVENKRDCAIRIFDILSAYSFKLNFSYSGYAIKTNTIDKILKNLSKELSLLINAKVAMSYVGGGANGTGYKMVVSQKKRKKEFFYKVFYPNSEADSVGEYRHGSALEIMYAYFTFKNDSKNHFAKFYAGRFSTQYEKDAFLLTEFVHKKDNSNRKCNKLNLEFIKTDDKRAGNKISGKIVDFGALTIAIPELYDKKIKKIFRIVTSRISYKFDENTITYYYYISRANCKFLKQYIKKTDFDLYKKVLKLLKKYMPIVPKKLLQDLKNINKWNEAHFVDITKYFNLKDIITTDMKLLKRNIKTLNLKIKSSISYSEGTFGYFILDLYDKKHAVYFLNKDNNITKIRIEKQVGNEFVTLLDLAGSQIDEYKNHDISKILI